MQLWLQLLVVTEVARKKELYREGTTSSMLCVCIGKCYEMLLRITLSMLLLCGVCNVAMERLGGSLEIWNEKALN